MTRKHFKAVAEILKTVEDAQERDRLAQEFCKLFACVNPRFDSTRFLGACGLNTGN
jgi:hypothetical protein